MAEIAADRNLLFGVLALQADLIDARQFAEACSAWATRKGGALADLLVERGWLSADGRAAVEVLVAGKLKKYGGDPRRSLAAVADGPARSILAGVATPEVQATLDALAEPDGHRVVSTIAHQPATRDHYTLTRLHAKGGIGQVWLARDANLGREVALKELRPERAGNPTAWSRFVEEARITGQLEHPGIVPVYELIPEPEGRKTFYTMRFVRGRTLSEAIRAYHDGLEAVRVGALDLLALLNAFVGVCHAVAYAHSRGVIHRDLKPQNVVLGDFGEAVLLDWGLAKVVDRTEAANPAPTPVVDRGGAHDATIQGQVLGTPAYMAPEQAAGRIDQVDRPTDVYGLGAILYEILAGRPPFTGDDTQDVLRRVQDEEPPAPRSLNPKAPRALEAIARKAMAKRPADRYASAGDLAREVQRYSADEPVAAWREPLFVRVRRWVRRHRMLVASAAAAAIVALAALTALSVIQARANADLTAALDREAAARAQAEARFGLAQAAIEAFYTGASEDVLLRQAGLADLRTKLLKTALDFYQRWRADIERQADAQAPNQLFALLIAIERIAEIQAQIGAREEALKVYEQAAALGERIAPEIGAARSRIGKTFVWIGRLQRQLGRPEEAIRAFRRSVEVFEPLSSSPNYLGDLGWAHLQLGSLEAELGRRAEARASLERSGELTIKAMRSSRGLWLRQDLAAVHTTLANLDAQDGRYEAALRRHEEARALMQRIVDEEPNNDEFRADLARAFNNIGYDLTELGRRDEARTILEEGLAIREELARSLPLDVGRRSDLGRSAYYLARLHLRAGRRDEARARIEEAEGYFARVPGVVPEDQFYLACLKGLRIALADDAEPRRQLADAAMTALRRAISGGFRNLQAIRTEPDLAPLRDRDDYRALSGSPDPSARP